MKLLLLLSCLAAAKAGVPQSCTGPVVGGVHYTDEVLEWRLKVPVYLNYDKSTNSLYFTHYFTSKYVYKLDLDSTKVSNQLVSGVNQVYSVTIDSKTNDIFLGTNEGIFKYNKNNNKAELYGANGTYIKQLSSKDNIIYFNIFHSHGNYYESHVYKLVDGEVSRLEELKNTTVRSFIIDNDGYIVFANSMGVFRQKLGTEEAILYATGKVVRGFTINTHGAVFAAASDGIYFVNKQKHTFDQIFAVEGCFGVALDSENNIFYFDEEFIHRLQPSVTQECV